jgi:hypothetical protein
MIGLSRRRRRPPGGVAYDERTGTVCDARCRAVAHLDRERARALARRGPLG